MAVESAPITEPQSCQDELLGLAYQLCSNTLGETVAENCFNRYDEVEFRSYMYRPPLNRGLLVIARYFTQKQMQRGLIVATFDFIEPEFPLRMQVRAAHPPEYYQNEFYEDRAAEINGYLNRPEDVFVQSLRFKGMGVLKV